MKSVDTQQDSPSSQNYDWAFQKSLTDELGFLNLSTTSNLSKLQSPIPAARVTASAAIASHIPATHALAAKENFPAQFHSPTSDDVRPKVSHGPIKLPEIPPYQGHLKSSPHQKLSSQPLSAGAHLRQRPLPPVIQKPLPEFSAAAFLPSQKPLPELQSSAMPLRLADFRGGESPPPPFPREHSNARPTALFSVIVPALEAALQRRAYALRAAVRTTTDANDEDAKEINDRRQYAHDKLKRLVIEVAGIFEKIENWDNDSRVGMGGGVDAFLEGFLEEMLVRVEAEDVEEERANPG